MILWIVLYSKQLRSNNLNKRFFKTDIYFKFYTTLRGGSSVAAASKMERFVIIVQGWKPLTIITKHSILNAAAALDPSLWQMCFIVNFITFSILFWYFYCWHKCRRLFDIIKWKLTLRDNHLLSNVVFVRYDSKLNLLTKTNNCKTQPS